MNSTENEMLRHAALDVLVARHPTALRTEAVRRHVVSEVGFRFGEEDLASALAVLEELGLAARRLDALGSGSYWQATAKAKLESERQ